MSKQYKQYSLFKDLKSFNSHFEQHMVDLKGKLTKSEAVALKRLVRYSCKIAGVCFAKIQTIVAATHEHDGIGISRSTFERMLRKAKSFGLLEVVNTYKRGKQSHNIYIFQPYISKQTKVQLNESDVPCTNDAPIKQAISESSNQSKDIRIDHVDEFEKYASIFFHDYKTIRELKKISIIHTRINSIQGNHAKLLSLECLKTLIAKIKSKPISNVCGYFNGVCRKRMRSLKIKQLWDECW
jgi:hypothetical protein